MWSSRTTPFTTASVSAPAAAWPCRQTGDVVSRHQMTYLAAAGPSPSASRAIVVSAERAPCTRTSDGGRGAEARLAIVTGVEAGHIGEIDEIDAVDRVAEGDAVLGADVLVLAVLVLGAFGDAHGGEAGPQHRRLVAAAAKAVHAVDHADIEVCQMLVGDGVHVAGEVARGTVDLTAAERPAVAICWRLSGADAFGEDADGCCRRTCR